MCVRSSSTEHERSIALTLFEGRICSFNPYPRLAASQWRDSDVMTHQVRAATSLGSVRASLIGQWHDAAWIFHKIAANRHTLLTVLTNQLDVAFLLIQQNILHLQISANKTDTKHKQTPMTSTCQTRVFWDSIVSDARRKTGPASSYKVRSIQLPIGQSKCLPISCSRCIN